MHFGFPSEVFPEVSLRICSGSGFLSGIAPGFYQWFILKFLPRFLQRFFSGFYHRGFIIETQWWFHGFLQWFLQKVIVRFLYWFLFPSSSRGQVLVPDFFFQEYRNYFRDSSRNYFSGIILLMSPGDPLVKKLEISFEFPSSWVGCRFLLFRICSDCLLFI